MLERDSGRGAPRAEPPATTEPTESPWARRQDRVVSEEGAASVSVQYVLARAYS